MADQAGIYAGAAVGVIALLGIGAAILYRKHQQDQKDIAARERVVQERMQHVVDMNLPPFYVDHELDPVCIYEHELPLDAVPPVQPILVHSTSDEHIIPPEDDPLASSPTVPPPLPRELSSFRFPSSSSTNNTQQVGVEATSTSSVLSPTADHVDAAQETLHNPALTIQAANMPTSPAPAALLSPPLPAAAASPRIINEEMLNLARLPAPPSYHVPNLVIDRSPHHHPYSHHQHSHSASEASQMIVPSRVRDDYFGSVRIRSHTFSHPPPQQQQHQGHTQEYQEEDLPPTPRYSLEFPSHVPHQRHLEQYRRARAQHAMRAPTCPSSPMIPQSAFDRGASTGPQALMMQERSHSQPYDPTWSVSNSSLEDGLGPRRQQQQQQQRRPGTPRSRASTIGESSKLLMQRMQVLWKKTNGSASTLTSPYVSGQNSLNASTIHLDDRQGDDRQGDGSCIVGLGLDQDFSAVDLVQNSPEEVTAAVVEDEPAVATLDSNDSMEGHETVPEFGDQSVLSTTLPSTDAIPTLPMHAMSIPLVVS
ncbi:hypothetical protein BGZ67_007293 [Mortierella alpina]|nr:hypothetical protein BGZ67_007293 [Mortierella alpina]